MRSALRPLEYGRARGTGNRGRLPPPRTRRAHRSKRAARAVGTGEYGRQAVRPPARLDDVDATRLMGYAAELADDHPGFGDDAYTRRRADIGRAAGRFALDPSKGIPHVVYTSEEHATWMRCLDAIAERAKSHSCAEYAENLDVFLDATNARAGIPQLSDVDRVLADSPGAFHVRPVGGLLHPRSFLNALAFSTFHSTQYVRHASSPLYTPEPDIIHELLGHLPLLMNSTFADCMRHLGRASLRAPDVDIWHITKVYWYTVEFGVVHSQHDGRHLGYGAGVLSSIAELDNLVGAPENGVTFQALDPYAALPKISYNEGVQKSYMTVTSIQHMRDMLHAFADFCEELYAGGGSLKQWRASSNNSN